MKSCLGCSFAFVVVIACIGVFRFGSTWLVLSIGAFIVGAVKAWWRYIRSDRPQLAWVARRRTRSLQKGVIRTNNLLKGCSVCRRLWRYIAEPWSGDSNGPNKSWYTNFSESTFQARRLCYPKSHLRGRWLRLCSRQNLRNQRSLWITYSSCGRRNRAWWI